MRSSAGGRMRGDETRPAWVIAFAAVALGGGLVGLLAGWLLARW